jgi:BA14K-like protein
MLGRRSNLAPKSNFHPVWGAAAPAAGLFRIVFTAAAVGATAGAIAMSSLERSPQASPHVITSDHGFRIDRTRQTMPATTLAPDTVKLHSYISVQPPIEVNSPEISVEKPQHNLQSKESEKQATNAQTDADEPPCNVSVCEQHYQSFRSSDCSYQPYSGPRRYCSR